MWTRNVSVWMLANERMRSWNTEKEKTTFVCLNPSSSHPVNANPQVDANIWPGQQGSNVLFSLLYHLIWPNHIALQAHMLLYHWELGRSPGQSQHWVLGGREPIPTGEEAWKESSFSQHQNTTFDIKSGKHKHKKPHHQSVNQYHYI